MLLVSRKNYCGFTLIELLVVIAIIAVLASILFPVFLSAKAASQKSSCANNLKQLGNAFSLYKDDFGGWYPLGGFKFAIADYTLEWQNAVGKYVKKEDIFRCPSTPCPDMDPNNPTSYGGDPNRPRTPITYLYNLALGAEQYSASQYQIRPKAHHESEVRRPGKCICLIEGNPGVVSSTFNGVDFKGRTKTLWLNDFTFYRNASVITGGDLPKKSYGLPHHHDGGNALFCDGHVSYHLYRDSASLQRSLPWLIHVPLTSNCCGYRVDDEPWKR